MILLDEQKTRWILEFLLFINLWLIVNDLIIGLANTNIYMFLVSTALILILLLNKHRKALSKKK